MTPDDWQKGMENEAASVEDGAWAREARQTAQFQRGTRSLLVLTVATLIYVLIGGLLVMAFNALSIGYGPQGLRPVVLGSPMPSLLTGLLIPLMAAVWLTRLGIRPMLVWMVPVLGTLLGILTARVLTIAVPMNFPEALSNNPIDLLPSGRPELSQVLFSLLVKALAVGLGIWIVRRQGLQRSDRAPKNKAS